MNDAGCDNQQLFADKFAKFTSLQVVSADLKWPKQLIDLIWPHLQLQLKPHMWLQFYLDWLNSQIEQQKKGKEK